MDILNSHKTLVPPPLEEFDSTIDPEFSHLVARMLAKRQADRPGIDEVVGTLDRLMARSGAAAAATPDISRSIQSPP